METHVRDDTILKVPIFHRIGKYDVEQHWFIYEEIWVVKQTIDENAKIEYLETTFRERYLMWYMKFKDTTLAKQARSLAQIKKSLLKEFQNPKLESQCITKIKDNKHQSIESIWYYGQIFKILLDMIMFQILYSQYVKWYIAGFLPHIRIQLTQQKVSTQSEGLEIE